MNKKYIVRLTADERKQLEDLTHKGKTAAYKIMHANILLSADSNGHNRNDKETAKIFGCYPNTVSNVRLRFVEKGLDGALNRKKQDNPSRQPRLDGNGEAQLIAISCSKPPEGHRGWTLKLLADKLVQLQVVDSICDQTVRRVLKKTT